MTKEDTGFDLHKFAKKIWKFPRSISGNGTRQTLNEIKLHLPNLTIQEVKSGSKVFDWEVPSEWEVKDAYIITPEGHKICDFQTNNLHLVGYSKPIECEMSFSELKERLHFLIELPNAIPYVTSYYNRDWGFCLSYDQFLTLNEGIYKVVIKSRHFKGSISYGELIIQGKSKKEILLSTNICHPMMANNELSGICISTFLAKWLKDRKNRYTYRILFLPETIGSIAYLSKHLKTLKKNVLAGYVLACIGDERTYSYLQSRAGNTLSDLVAKHVLSWIYPNYKKYSWKWAERGSDERQFCAPGIDLPIASIMRSKYAEYPEYHTSLDDLETLVTPKGLSESLELMKKVMNAIEKFCYPKALIKCEPQLGKRGLYPNLSKGDAGEKVSLMMDLISMSDGNQSIIEIADHCNVPIWELMEIAENLAKQKIIKL